MARDVIPVAPNAMREGSEPCHLTCRNSDEVNVAENVICLWREEWRRRKSPSEGHCL